MFFYPDIDKPDFIPILESSRTRGLEAPTIRSLEEIFKETRTIAVVGLSPKPHRDSYRVAAYLQAQGYRIIPVNPAVREVLGEPAYPSLSEVPGPVDMVDVFRRSEFVPGIVDEAVSCRARVLWTQYGIVHDQAAAVARTHGLDVVMDRCTQVEHAALVRQGKLGEGV